MFDDAALRVLPTTNVALVTIFIESHLIILSNKAQN